MPKGTVAPGKVWPWPPVPILMSTRDAGSLSVAYAVDFDTTAPNALASMTPTALTAEAPSRNVLLEITRTPQLRNR